MKYFISVVLNAPPSRLSEFIDLKKKHISNSVKNPSAAGISLPLHVGRSSRLVNL
jgi:hypothetical protein